MKTQNKSKSTSLQKPMRRFQKPKKSRVVFKNKIEKDKKNRQAFPLFLPAQPSTTLHRPNDTRRALKLSDSTPMATSLRIVLLSTDAKSLSAMNCIFSDLWQNSCQLTALHSLFFGLFFFLALDATESCVRRACSAFFVDSWLQPLLWVQALFSTELSREFLGLVLLPWPKKQRSSSFFLVCQMPPFSHFLIFHLFKVKRHISRFHLHTAFCGGPSVSTTSWLAIHQRTGGISHPQKASQTSIVIKRSSVEIVIGLRS